MKFKCVIVILTISSIFGCASPRQLSSDKVDYAIELANDGEWNKSIEVLNEALIINPRNADALILRGISKHKAGLSAKESLADMDASLSIRKTAENYLRRAVVLFDNGLYDAAISDCNQAIRYANAKGLDPDTVEKQQASGESVSINWGSGIDEYFSQIRSQANKLLEKAQKLKSE